MFEFLKSKVGSTAFAVCAIQGIVAVNAWAFQVQITATPPATANNPLLVCDTGTVNVSAQVDGAPTDTEECHIEGSPTYEWTGATGTGASATVNISANSSSPISVSCKITYHKTPKNSKVQCPDEVKEGTYSVVFMRKKVTQISGKPDKFDVCVGAQLGKSDFNIGTTPSDLQSEVTLEFQPDMSQTVGTHTVIARLCGSQKQWTYKVVGSGTWVFVPESAKNLPPAGAAVNVSTGWQGPKGVNNGTFTAGYTWYRWKMDVTGGAVWNSIGSAIKPFGSTYKTTQSTKWGLSAQVGVSGEVAVPFVASGKVSVTVTGSWESTETHELSSGPDEAPYQWRYTHYQKNYGLSENITCEKAQGNSTAPTGAWTAHNEPGFSGQHAQGVSCGSTDYLTTKERQCP